MRVLPLSFFAPSRHRDARIPGRDAKSGGMETATTFQGRPSLSDEDAFLHPGGKIRRWGEETMQLPALSPDSTFAIRLVDRRRTYRWMAVVLLVVLGVLGIAGLALGPTFSEETSVLLPRAARAAAFERSPLLDAKRTAAPSPPSTHRASTARSR